jgi:hypothetical protein
MKFYKDILKPLKTVDLSFSIDQQVGDQIVKMKSSSSCIINDEDSDGYLLNIRCVNYRIDEKGNYHDCDKYIISSNKYVKLSNDLEIVYEKMFNIDFCDRKYIGVEDVRIFKDILSNNLMYIGVGYHMNNQIGIVSENYDISEDSLSHIELKTTFNDNTGCEKNWVFVDYDNSTHIVYKWFPLEICKLNSNKISLVTSKNMPRIFINVRGSSCGFKYNNEIWFTVHIVSYEQPRHYYHMLVVFNETMDLQRYSAPFKFEGEPIEYSLGLVVEKERVLISYSKWDRTTKISIYDKSYIDEIVKYKM